jgi:hypothetical protein
MASIDIRSSLSRWISIVSRRHGKKLDIDRVAYRKAKAATPARPRPRPTGPAVAMAAAPVELEELADLEALAVELLLEDEPVVAVEVEVEMAVEVCTEALDDLTVEKEEEATELEPETALLLVTPAGMEAAGDWEVTTTG